MDTINHHAAICYLGPKGLTPKDMHGDMVVTLGEVALSYSMAKKWAAEFQRDRESPGRPVILTTQEAIAKIHDIITEDRRVTERYIATESGISLNAPCQTKHSTAL